MMSRYKIILAYDGTRFSGWQKQPGKISIEQTIEDTFKKAFKKDLQCLAASRTDAGVHAMGQVLLGIYDLDLSPDRVLKIWNDRLPIDIKIRSIEPAADQFHPWYNIELKEYHYYLSD